MGLRFRVWVHWTLSFKPTGKILNERYMISMLWVSWVGVAFFLTLDELLD